MKRYFIEIGVLLNPFTWKLDIELDRDVLVITLIFIQLTIDFTPINE